MRPLNECARSHQGALDRTRAEACTRCVALMRIRAHNGSEIERAAMCA
jgi:hypothetical protein